MKSSRKEGSDRWLHDKPIAWLWILTLFLGSTYQLQENLPQMHPKTPRVNPCVLGELVNILPPGSLGIDVLMPTGEVLPIPAEGLHVGAMILKLKKPNLYILS